MKVVATEKAPKALGPYSQGYVHNGIFYSAGQIPINPETDTVEATDIAGQTEQVCKNFAAVLEAAGTSFDKVLKTTCFLSDMGDFAAFKCMQNILHQSLREAVWQLRHYPKMYFVKWN